MKVYHGGTAIVKEPLAGIGRSGLDFGQGFYVTVHKKQACGRVIGLNVWQIVVNRFPY